MSPSFTVIGEHREDATTTGADDEVSFGQGQSHCYAVQQAVGFDTENWLKFECACDSGWYKECGYFIIIYSDTEQRKAGQPSVVTKHSITTGTRLIKQAKPFLK